MLEPHVGGTRPPRVAREAEASRAGRCRVLILPPSAESEEKPLPLLSVRAPPCWPLWAALLSVSFQGLGQWSLLTTARAPMNGEPPDFGNCGCLFKALQTVYSQWGRVHRPGLPCLVCPEGLRRRQTSGWCSHTGGVLAGRAAGLGSTGRDLAPAWPHTPSG